MKKALKKFFIALFFLTLFQVRAFSVDYFQEGKRYFYLKDYKTADKLFENAIKSTPANPDYRYYKAQTLVHLNKLDSALKEYRKIIELSPLSEAARLSFIGINNINTYKLNQTRVNYSHANNKVKSVQNSFIGENYIDNALEKGLVLHWHSYKMPVKIYWETQTNPTIFKNEYLQAAQKAFEQWINASEGAVNYKTVKDKANANITVRFVKSIGKSQEHEGKTGFISGLATHNRKGPLLENIDVQLSMQKPDGTLFSYEEIHNTAIHEFGHALGIMGHSINKKDVMYAVTNDETNKTLIKLTERDKNTLKLLYKLEPDVSNFSQEEIASLNSKKIKEANDLLLGNNEKRLQNKLQEAKDYVKQVPYHPISWTALGSAYKDLKKYPEAINNYKKALSIDSDYIDARQNLISIYNEQGDTISAINEYKKLIEIDPSNISYSYNLAIIYYKNKQIIEAKNIVLKLISINPAARENQQIKELLSLLGI